MNQTTYSEIFSEPTLAELFPAETSNAFFEALYGDPDEGVYDINLMFRDYSPGNQTLNFALTLNERPGKCLACKLTYGLPEVFSRHPIINIKGLVEKICAILPQGTTCGEWQLGSTQQLNRRQYVVPLSINLASV
ncbi:MAG: pancreas/duodenum homeobox protein 1 [Proteobacteria bacterium]|nr:pancreas/duodenum homeobox protein 1 [Pseudomonadota bacterium]MBU1688901.1 pancreas/duodenum homeobox protein 1 [Pseudomonadota bacterium]